MNWLHFFMWLGGLYILYYLAVLLLDVAGAKNAPAANSLTHELTFSENVAPAKLMHDAPAASDEPDKTRLDGPAAERKQEPEMIGSGGVVLDGLFKLCKQEAIVYTRSVSY
jgi:hypothetical protein